MTTTTTESRDELEAERDFLLRSLDDLEAERAAGSIDDESYRQLHDDYTARAAAVIRALRDGVDTRPKVEKPSTGRRVATVVLVVGFAIGAGVALAAALGARLPGQTSSGNSPQLAPTQRQQTTPKAALERAIDENPDDVRSRTLLAQRLESEGDLAGALRQYDEITRIDPTSSDASAQSGRILYLTATRAPSDQVAALVAESRARLDHAVDLDPANVDARYFRAIVLANEYQDFAAAQSDLQRYLVAQPNGRFVDDARMLLAQVTEAMQPGTTTTTTKP